ncbi:MAG: hypothetical protein IJ572_03420 [Bacilli bacterium]|nr:hypothetical protein [Bacilli bacterium]
MKKNTLKKALLTTVMTSLLSNSLNVYASDDLDSYLDDAIKYYQENPEKMEEDANKDEIVVDERGNKNFEKVAFKLKDIKNKLGDICYFKSDSIGNENSLGTGVPTKNFYVGGPVGYRIGVIVGVKSDAPYPFAIAKFDKETNQIGDIIGWYKDEDVFTQCDTYAETIEKPIVKYVTFGNIDQFDVVVDEDGNFHNENETFWLPYGYTALDDNNRHGVCIGYSSSERFGFDNYYDKWVSKIKFDVRSQVDVSKLELAKKYNIKSN